MLSNSKIMTFTRIRLFSIVIIGLFLFSTLLLKSQGQPNGKENAIVGIWHPEGKDYNIEIFKYGDEFQGKIVWLQEPNDKFGSPKIDKHNPERRHRGRQLLNMKNVSGLYFNARDNIWEDGYIYYPETGKTMLGNIEMIDNNTIRLFGFLGFSLEEAEYKWIRV